MLIIAIGVTIFLLTYILPKFEPLFAERQASLPVTTIFMMKASHSLIHYWYLWVLGLVASIIAFVLVKRTDPGRQLMDRIKINMPIMGPMCRKVAISRSIRTLGTLVASGVSMLDALRLSAEVAGNVHYRGMWLAVLDEVTGGKQICEALRGNRLLPPMLVQMISSGEQTGKLDEVLAKVSTYFDHEVDTSIKTATSMIEPLMIVVPGYE